VSDPSAFGVFLDTVERELGRSTCCQQRGDHADRPGGARGGPRHRAGGSDQPARNDPRHEGRDPSDEAQRPRSRHQHRLAHRSRPRCGVATYSATKAGVLAFSEAVSMELAGTGINLSVVQPSLVTTELVAGIKLKRGTPACRPEDVAECVIGLLNRPRFQAFVPRHVAPVAFINQALPAKLRHALTRVARADRLIAEMDQTPAGTTTNACARRCPWPNRSRTGHPQAAEHLTSNGSPGGVKSSGDRRPLVRKMRI